MDRNDPLTPEIELALLLQRTAAKDPVAFRALYDKTSAILFARLLRMLPQSGLAEEALQRAYLRIWERAAQYPVHRGQPLAWLLTAARYCALELAGRERLTQEADLAWAATDATPNHLDDASGGLTAGERRCLALAFVAGLSLNEIARSTAISLESVKREIRGGLLNLRTGETRDRRAA
jgi:RNA polymerase sigma-70 factor (ECF subfamily)